jgi:integrase
MVPAEVPVRTRSLPSSALGVELAAKPRKKRRVRSPHPGIVLVKPDASHPYWRARYKEPDLGRMVKTRLDPLVITTAEARRDWAVKKAKSIAHRKMSIEAGAHRATGVLLTTVVDRYFAAHPKLRARTREVYRAGADKMLAWAKQHGVTVVDDLTRAHLARLREHFIKTPKTLPAQGSGKAGKRVTSNEQRSPSTINQELTSVSVVLSYLVDVDAFPKLTGEDLRRALKRLPNTKKRVKFLAPADCKRLIEACLRHDAEMNAGPAEPRRGRKAGGLEPRYTPITPIVTALLLGGFRIGEALQIKWSMVDLNALDVAGRQVGEIHLPAEIVKTNKPRTVGLDVSPALRKMLAAMQLRSGGNGLVFKIKSANVDKSIERLVSKYGAPAFTPHVLRRTCGTYLVNAAGICGSASVFRAAQQLGHSVQVAESSYWGLLRGIPATVRTLEDAMQISSLVGKVAGRSVEGRRSYGG